MMSATPYQQGSEAIGDDEPLSPISTSSPVGSISSSHGSTTARRRNKSVSPTNMSISSLPHVPDLDDGDGDDGNSIAVDGRRATMRETICAYAVSKSKALIFGQLLAFWLVSMNMVVMLNYA